MVKLISLKDLLRDVAGIVDAEKISEQEWQRECGPLKLDSRDVEAGDTFVAVKGFSLDGRNFIPKAVANGAALILAEAKQRDAWLEIADDVTNSIIWIENLSARLSLIAGNYYDHPSTQLKTIAVTGTNGKTSCSYICARALQRMHFECYLLGTLGTGSCGQLVSSQNTTADAISLQRILQQAVDCGAQFAAMEISSHGLDQARAGALHIDTAIFTNLTHDHLDYHGSMENYFAAKRRLMLHPGLRHAVLNADDKYGRKLIQDKEITATKWMVSTQSPISGADLNHWLWAENIMLTPRGIHATIYSPWGSAKLDSPLMGQFNLSNLLLIIAALGAQLNELEPVLNALSSVQAPPGRMQKIEAAAKPLAIVDYAHTPDALEQTLIAIREHNVGLIWCVFGCGGDRDTSKRPLMARIAEKYANRVVVTQDNPRTENEEKIREEIFAGFKKPDKVVYFSERADAIKHALSRADASDVVLIAGKGHENYQIIGKDKTHFSDVEVAMAVMEGKQ